MSKVRGEKNSLYLPTVLAKNKYTYKIKKTLAGRPSATYFGISVLTGL